MSLICEKVREKGAGGGYLSEGGRLFDIMVWGGLALNFKAFFLLF